jgi:tol-pal system protein YbgF
MSLKNLSGTDYSLKNSLFVLFILVSFLLAACGEIEETTTQEKSQQTITPAVTSAPEVVKEEKPMEQVLRNFIGSEMDQLAESSPQPTAATSQIPLSEYEKQLDELRTENTGLKQKVVKFEQENRGLNARISEIETKYAAEKLRADKADEFTKTPPQLPKIEEPVEATAPSGTSYDDALKSYKQKKYADAAKKFKSVIETSTDEKVKTRAKYWLGESYFAQKKYKNALPLFQETLKAKGSEKKADAQYMLAQTYDRLGSKAKAKAAYEKVVKNYPMSKNVKKAKARWAKL